MAKADQIKALIRSHAEGDDTRFYSVAMQVAAEAARSGHGALAQELRTLVDSGRARPTAAARVVPLAQPRGELEGLLSVSYPANKLSEMTLADPLRARLDRVVVEQRQRERLRTFGLQPARKLLLTGPPGTGKTLTASALAGELGLPLFVVRLDGLLSRYLGESAARLRLLFDAANEQRGVFLFDELDAIAAPRASGDDVGEARRILNSLLMMLEQDDSDSVIIGATNHRVLLDDAIFRRFDLVLEYHLPTVTQAIEVMRGRLAALNTAEVRWDSLTVAAEGLSHAEVCHACDEAAKDTLLNDRTDLTTEALQLALVERRRMRPVGALPEDAQRHAKATRAPSRPVARRADPSA